MQADERRIVRAEVRATGWVEKLRVRAVNDPVRAGQVLADLYSPDLLAAQEEYLLVAAHGPSECIRRSTGPGWPPEPGIARVYPE